MPPLTHEKQLSDYMRKNYLINSKSSDYIVNQEGKLVWGIPYALYKAGAWPQFILALNNLGRAGISLRQEFTKFQDNL